MEFTQFTIAQAAAGLRRKQFSSRELTEAHLRRLEYAEPKLNAYITRTAEAALAQSDNVDAQLARGEELSPLAGIPGAIKDVLHWEGTKTTCASRMLADYVSPYTATSVQRLLNEGLVVVGKTNCDEFAMGASGENSAFGSTKNPWSLDRVPGGSSSGSAAAVASGSAIYALGSDTGGSVRQPAGFCNLVGVKPSYGRVSRYGLSALVSSFDQVGIFTRSIADAALVLQSVAGHDALDSTSSRVGVEAYTKQLSGDVKGMKLGVPQEYFIDGMDTGVRRAVEEAIAQYRALGCDIVEVNLPHTADAIAVYYVTLTAEASANLARYDGIRYGLSTKEGAKELAEVYQLSRGEGFGAEVKRRIMLGTFVLSSGYVDAYYKTAQKVRALIAREYAQAFERVDALITPTSPSVAFKLGEKFQDPLTMYLADVYTAPANLAGLPAISLPGGFAHDLPVGIQLIGPAFGESRLLQLGHAYERATDWHTRFAKVN